MNINNSCPFCEYNNLEIIINYEDFEIYILCKTCKARGPINKVNILQNIDWEIEKEKIIKRWNRRITKKEIEENIIEKYNRSFINHVIKMADSTDHVSINYLFEILNLSKTFMGIKSGKINLLNRRNKQI